MKRNVRVERQIIINDKNERQCSQKCQYSSYEEICLLFMKNLAPKEDLGVLRCKECLKSEIKKDKRFEYGKS